MTGSMRCNVSNMSQRVLRGFQNPSEIFNVQGPVVQKPISANPGLSVNQGFNFSC